MKKVRKKSLKTQSNDHRVITRGQKCEPAAKDEINTYNLTITEEMTREDVKKTVLEFVLKV